VGWRSLSGSSAICSGMAIRGTSQVSPLARLWRDLRLQLLSHQGRGRTSQPRPVNSSLSGSSAACSGIATRPTRVGVAGWPSWRVCMSWMVHFEPLLCEFGRAAIVCTARQGERTRRWQIPLYPPLRKGEKRAREKRCSPLTLERSRSPQKLWRFCS